MRMTVEEFVKKYNDEYREANINTYMVEHTVQKWKYYRDKIMTGSLSGFEYNSIIDNFPKSEYKSLEYFIERECASKKSWGGLGHMISSGLYLWIEHAGEDATWKKNKVLITTEEGKKEIVKEINDFLKKMIEIKEFNNLVSYLSSYDNISRFIRDNFLQAIVMINSYYDDSLDYSKKLVWIYDFNGIDSINLIEGNKDLFEEARNEDNRLIKNKLISEQIFRILGIDKPTIHDIRRVSKILWDIKNPGKTKLTTSEWKETLYDKSIIDDEIHKYLKFWFEHEGYKSSCKEAGQYFKPEMEGSYASISNLMSRACEKICNKYGISYESNDGWITVMMDITVSGRVIDWTLKPELVEALKEYYREGGEVRMSNNTGKEISLNTILYGPPGTGKTYNSKNYAVAICNYDSNLDEVLKLSYENDVLPSYQTLEKEGKIAFITFHQSYSYEEFIEGIKPKMVEDKYINYSIEDGIFKDICKKAESDKDNNYVIIIDEINRGNISKIFGELITLIEKSKRKGNKEEMSCKLPYSNDIFAVPNNLYIIGTMNTADRSIALMDTALRRRFDFVEMMPNSKLLNGIKVKDIDIEQMLNVMNKRIEVLYDREHTLGHSFFMALKENNSINDLSLIFKNKIIPLLQEYFYDDYSKIRLVLGDDGKSEEYQFIKKEKIGNNLFKGKEDLDDIPEYKYTINEFAFNKEESYKLIY